MLRVITELIYKYKVEIFLIQYSHEHTQYHLLSLSLSLLSLAKFHLGTCIYQNNNV